MESADMAHGKFWGKTGQFIGQTEFWGQGRPTQPILKSLFSCGAVELLLTWTSTSLSYLSHCVVAMPSDCC